MRPIAERFRLAGPATGRARETVTRRNGNKYLAWAFSEASELARRFDPEIRAWFDRKVSRTSRMCAHSALGHKLARAAYYIMRDQVPFDKQEAYWLDDWRRRRPWEWGWKNHQI